MVGSIAPRPIAFVSTINENGQPNLAPYSFFNAFSSNPPIVVFSSNRRVANNTTKDTLHNVRLNGEVVINVVNHAIVRQMAVASVEFPSDVSEFDKTGLTPLASDLVKPFRVAESPVHLECKVKEIITLGEYGGAGHLVICDVLRMHINEAVIDDRNRIDPHKLDLMGRLGRSYYVRVHGEAIQTIVQPVLPITVGFDALPESVRNSTVLTGNDLGKLAAIPYLPTRPEAEILTLNDKRTMWLIESKAPETAFHQYAQEELDRMNVDFAMKILMVGVQQD
jgi:flavin reductase (DIM6/NTAB) family NADH-FMN oxidoreductase RutF